MRDGLVRRSAFMVILFNKPYGVLSQFTDADGRATLADYIDIAGIYPAGRLDRDSEGLLVLTDDGRLQHRLADPRHRTWKTYWAQVEREPEPAFYASLQTGVKLKDGMTRPARARRLPAPDIWPRDPPIRYRANVPTAWVELSLCEGRNRQVRRMMAAAGHPVLRLIRYAVGDWTLSGLAPGEWRRLD